MFICTTSFITKRQYDSMHMCLAIIESHSMKQCISLAVSGGVTSVCASRQRIPDEGMYSARAKSEVSTRGLGNSIRDLLFLA